MQGSKIRTAYAIRGLMFLLALLYLYAFYRSIAPYWFDPKFCTDDALQQAYPLHEVSEPGLFAGDLVTKMMKSYLAPLHYWMWWGVTWLTRDPLMTGHWMTLVQFAATLGLFCFGVYRAAGLPAALFSFIWLLHSRHVMQRLTGGLPRGWSAVIFAAFFWFVAEKRHNAILALLFAGCLLNPPGALVAGAAYGLFLLIGALGRSTKQEFTKPLIRLSILTPIYAIAMVWVTRMPPDIGSMASYANALQMPEFYSGGRFPFVPLIPIRDEVREFAFQAFNNKWFKSPPLLYAMLPWIVAGGLLTIAAYSVRAKRALIPIGWWCFFISAVCVYVASRVFAFHLYVPNRHLLIPFGMFFIAAFSTAVARFYAAQNRTEVRALGALAVLAVFIVANSGPGVIADSRGYGPLNFNTVADRQGRVWNWAKKFSPKNALFAGEPNHLDGLQLFGMRRAYVTGETMHPFYDAYYSEIKRRVELSLRAHYARTLCELVKLLTPEQIDYFVFARYRFYPEELAKASFFRPYDQLVVELTKRDPSDFAFRQISRNPYPNYVAFQDERSLVVDIKLLREYLTQSFSCPAPDVS